MQPTVSKNAETRSQDLKLFGLATLPRRPRFLQELVVVAREDELIVDGGNQLHAFEGKPTTSLLSTLIPLLDGRRTLGELNLLLPEIPESHVRDAVSSLFRWGLVEDGDANRTEEPVSHSDTLDFLRRYLAVTGNNRSGREAYERLRASEVGLLSCDDTSEQIGILSSLLQQTGIGRVTLLDHDGLEGWNPGTNNSRGQTLLLSLSFDLENSALHTKVDQWCFTHRLPWLRAVINNQTSTADIGPLFDSRENPCYQCFNAVHCRPHEGTVPQIIKISDAETQFFSSMVAIEIVYLLSRIAPPRLRREFQRYDLQQWQSQSLRWCRAPGCFRCRPLAPMHLNHGSTHAGSRLTDTAIVFEDYIELQSREASSAQKDEAQADASRTLIRQNKILPNCSQISLSSQMPKLDRGVLDVLHTGTRPSSETLTRDGLGCLLMLTAGIRDTGNDQVQRWGATGGNLGSVELYVAVRRVGGLAPGFYFYQSFDHSLALFQRHSGALDIESFMQRAILADAIDLPDVLILFTSAFHRVSKKYGVFGYRLVNLDAGAAISQLHLAARSMNIFSRTTTSWADDLIAEQLNLDSPREHSTAVVALSGTVNHATELQASCPQDSKMRPGQPPSAKPLRDFCDVDVEGLFKMLYRESRIQKDELDRGTFACPAELLLANSFPSTSMLPPPGNCGRSAGEVLAQRRSIRRYAPASISTEQLSTMLYSAHYGDADDWPLEHRNMQSLTFFALVSNVEGLNPGIYQYQPQDHGLRLCAPSPSYQNMQELFVQAEFVAAPLVIWIAGNLAAACARHGALGHRQLLLRAGAAGHRLWMAALAMDLSGVLVAGLVPGAARRQFGLDGYKQASLLAFVAGHPARYRMQPLIHNGAVGAQVSQR